MFNAMDGSENYLIKLRKGFDYEVPSIDAKPEPLPKKQKKGQKKRIRKLHHKSEIQQVFVSTNKNFFRQKTQEQHPRPSKLNFGVLRGGVVCGIYL